MNAELKINTRRDSRGSTRSQRGGQFRRRDAGAAVPCSPDQFKKNASPEVDAGISSAWSTHDGGRLLPDGIKFATSIGGRPPPRSSVAAASVNRHQQTIQMRSGSVPVARFSGSRF
jgi:hypothetical protein